ncbi:HNH endonuclease [Bacillus phage vB_BanS_MrDarsey]|uniref:HNH endonuclease n=1 Tax=Bacillus phage vB_BanS_MrDarsey TaxID=2894787 RepID=A0AAE8YQE2_9CAUD|nr:HNH endonuclease [Bacillus phage vB_BanS_MrDarsey]UGO48010.1 HNH endonuclease [Bacillus phage vB_BanS_MrDarsey]
MNWKDLKGYEGLYQVSDTGELRSLDRRELCTRKDGQQFFRSRKGKTLVLSKDDDGYLVTSISKDGNPKGIKIHRLVAEAFIPNPENKEQVNHIDGNKENNHVDNLEWSTNHENITHAVETKLRNDKGVNNNNAKLSLEDVKYIKENYQPRHKEFGAKALAEKFGVHSITIGKVAKRDYHE